MIQPIPVQYPIAGRNLRTLQLQPDSVEEGIWFYSVPSDKLRELATQYVGDMETQQTDKWCLCEWLIHPDDIQIKEDHCRVCKAPKKEHAFGEDMEEGKEYCIFSPRRKRRGEAHLECPVHTKEGFLLGFFVWLFPEESEKEG